jgi:hypothetical protein
LNYQSYNFIVLFRNFKDLLPPFSVATFAS